ncbi:hypothetical protein CGRA01v4_13160 [Colletotrichum graminicola]|uniref:Uncharacterized protein n=1 Tax=Colletotrichum graminicola (strain M1.001 / M2 / FGSC 10212) TaxID=645133 RepID=E3QM90_COLGM|nr:uncharacterized protein GLRG_07122 [Colletotrichum graminicola M1.001]EFQ31978.1 hypothetical protein GLRG_07122 [Colletotrichum graminicola M1.001]WDK21870.1 hypothetical protein CGRA01v4_13160 [Colletotrichum graminicola]
MAGPIQLGDVINFSKLAWDVYKFGWDNDFNATRQYAEFGRDVRGLAENLDILTRVVDRADQSLRQDGVFRPLRWDPSSLEEIIGDYKETLTECCNLIAENHRYRVSGGPLRNIEWNVLVAPAADRLRARIELHNSKVLHVLKPFEIDLLSRVREDIRLVHQDLAHRISAVHLDLHRLIGVLVPDLEHALAQQARREPIQLEIPQIVADGLQHAWAAERQQDGSGSSLQEMADVFVLHYHKSTANFTAGILVENRIPDIEQYLSLLKCIWVMRHIRESPELRQSATGSLSHWPSYIQQLEDDLALQCDRFRQDLVPPALTGLLPEMFDIWPEKELAQLVDVVTRDALMEQVLDIPMQGAAANVHRKLQLLRRMGTDGKRFRINITGVEQGGTSRNARRQAETIDFDITSVIINPLYAVPSNAGVWDMVLRKDERVAKLTFTQLKDAVRFQHATTGFKAFDSYSQYKAMVSFVVSGAGEPIVESACVQLWVPKVLDGQLVTNNESSVEQNAGSRSASVAYSGTGTATRQSTLRGGGGPWDTVNPFMASPTETVSMWNSASSPPTGPPARNSSMPSPPTTNDPSGARPPMAIPRRPVGSGGRQAPAASPPNSYQQPSATWTSPTSPRSSSLFQASRQPMAPSVSTATTRPDRTFSVSSNMSVMTTPSNNSSSGSEARTATVRIGGYTTGTVHRRPPKPMLVFFTRNPKTGKPAMVAVDIDEDTQVNPDRCNCRRSGRDGSSCQIAAIEQDQGNMDMSVRRFESRDSDVDWNVAKLALGRRGEREYADAVWKDVRRISIWFPTSQDRAKFGGTPNICQCSARTEAELSECLKRRHKGLLGLVRESGRQQLNEYHRARFASQHDVVRGMRDDYR